MSRKTLGLSAAAVAMAILIAVAILHRRPTVDVATAEVTRGSITRQVLTTGTLEPEKAVDTGSQVSGTVQSIDADFNTRVKEGQVIARLDPSMYDAEVSKALGAVSQADADAMRLAVVDMDARTKLERAEALAKEELIPETDLEDARLTAKQAAADLRAQRAAAESARAALKQAQVNRDYTIIHSPIDGVVVNRAVEVGQTLAASFQSPVLFTIADLRQMNLMADIDQSEVGDIKPGTHVTFQVESMGPRTFEATVSELRLQPNVEEAASPSGTASSTTASATGAAAARGSTTSSTGNNQSSNTAVGTTGLTASNGPGVVSYTAVISVPNPDGALAPGTTATIALPVGSRTDVVRVPNNALTFRPSVEVFEALKQTPPQLETEKEENPVEGRLGYVWKLENNRFVPIKVRTGLADEQWTEVLSGEVKPGDRFVTTARIR